jgi:flagellar biogenesis protein FliO
MVDPILVGMVAFLLFIVFTIYLFLRRITTGFKEGVERGRDGGG